jgi:hypothetical protein
MGLIRKPLGHLPGTVEIGIHPWSAHFSSVPVAIEGEHLPTEVGYNAELQSGQDPGEVNERTDELPWDRFWQFAEIHLCNDHAVKSAS